ncbi:MAG: LuxR C-terminal-related transcriptional regulator [Methylococcales bacterium]
MHPRLQSKRQAENHVRLLCSLGLDWRLLMPDLFSALRAVVPFTQGALVWYNAQLQGQDGISDWHFPGEEAVNALLITEFYQKNRMLELFLSGAEILQLPSISRAEQWLRGSRRDYLSHDIYQQVIRPSQTHHHLNLRLALCNDLMAVLTINRPVGEPDFSATEMQLLEYLLPFLSFAVSQPEANNNDTWADAEQGLLLFDRGGVVHYLDKTAENIVDYALERRMQSRNDCAPQTRNPWLTCILKKLAAQLEAVRCGNPDALPAIIRQRNCWGQYEFRGRWLQANQPGAVLLYAANLYRQIPLPLKLAFSLNGMQLSLRESQVALAIALGETHNKIAAKLHISERTVVGHTQNIYQKLAVPNRVELLAMLLQRNSMGSD